MNTTQTDSRVSLNEVKRLLTVEHMVFNLAEYAGRMAARMFAYCVMATDLELAQAVLEYAGREG